MGTNNSPEKKNNTVQKVVSSSLALGLAIGLLIELHTNDTAKDKATRAAYCLEQMSERETMNKADVDCVSEVGTGHGEFIDPRKLPEGTSKDVLHTYVQSQRLEGARIEMGRMVMWGMAGSCELLYPALFVQAIDD